MVELDGFGKACPMPLVMVKKEIDKGNTDITIKVDNETAVKNITRLAKKKGLGFTVDTIEGGFSISFADGSVWMPGVLSRKKQVAAVLADYAG